MRRLAPWALYAGTAATVLGLSKAHAAAHGYDYSGSARLGWSVLLIATLLVAAYAFGLPELPRHRRTSWVAALGAVMAGVLVVSAVQLVTGAALLPRTVVLGAALVLVPWYALCARVAQDAYSRAEVRARVLLVGHPDESDALRRELESVPERAAVIVAELTPSAALPTDPPMRPLVDVAQANGATVVVLSRAAQAEESIVLQAALLHEAGVRIRTLSLFYEQWLGKLPVAELERVSLLFDIGEIHAATYARFKRLLDLTTAAVGLLVLVAVIPLVAVGNLLANRGPLMFRQPRAGRNGVEFDIWKFRTMQPIVDDDEHEPTRPGDPRVTPFGGVLRRTHLDELPQVLNILRGELSIVGPRPEQPHLVARLSDKIPFYRLRHLVRPGLTGWAQVKYHYGADDVDTLEKLQYEFFYLRHQCLSLDLRIIGRTLRSVTLREGR